MNTPSDGMSPTMQMYVFNSPAVGPTRSGAIDFTVVAHEWGHYLHHRLTYCGTVWNQCGSMSEGFGDFIALHSIVRSGDNLDGTYAVGTYVTRDAYYGVRRMPYSANMVKNPATYKNMRSSVFFTFPAGTNYHTTPLTPNAEQHNAGEIWCSALFQVCSLQVPGCSLVAEVLVLLQGYVALLKAGGPSQFNNVRRKMANYLVSGMQLTPASADYIEGRDAILKAINAVSNPDAKVYAAAFAQRGFGASVVLGDCDASVSCRVADMLFFLMVHRRLRHCSSQDRSEQRRTGGVV